ncbi:cbb3-type cytochrome c oxidase N-terminal domain-containing protein [Niabella yanshanensis]|uniref:Cbb3-type cytochrome c oxidase N-terminal domain-containing protein n=1 Tax=Niabella yanshanensis TaxID=577386 RepID=A0ABZ0WBT1_9BACT|nr:cbb3-type cytochrome c oxidase N-terminal domain-containing protein [Niabella yanshanensis]WQD39987.1 cbb3-type cytochrome c oxidase N-terminal domain-containing protein [Niabella yanshanensis]
MKKLQTTKTTTLFILLLFAGAAPLTAQNTSGAPTSSFTLDANAVLIFAIALLAMVIGVLGYTLSASLDLYKKRKNDKNTTGQVVKSLLAGFLSLGALQAFGQDGSEAAAPVTGVFSDVHIFRYLLLGIITLELITIFALVYWIRFFTGIEELQREKGAERKTKLKDASSWWSRVNKLKPMEEEASLDVGHSYDGIKELDNVTPPWFTIAFIASIVFGIGYLWHYHVSKAGPNQYEEYEIAVTKANLEKEAYMKLKGDAINENTVTMLDATGVDAGKALYTSNCSACHGNAGQGGVGPNLTDDYWLHGGSIGDIFKTIKLGVVEKGMMSWKDVFSAEQIAQLASYIKSTQGSKPAGAKEPQGELYKETPKTQNADPVKTDSAQTAKL